MLDALHLLLLLMFSLVPFAHFSDMPGRCQFLLDPDQVMESKCKGKFPMVAFTKFRDTFIMPGEPISIYLDVALETSLALMKESKLHECHKIRFLDLHNYECIDDKGENKTVTVKKPKLCCFPFHIQIVDNLMDDCLRQTHQTDTNKLKDVLESKKGIIHYTFDHSATKFSAVLRGVDKLIVVLSLLGMLLL